MSATRRNFCTALAASLTFSGKLRAAELGRILRDAPSRVVPAAPDVKIERSWAGDFCRTKLVNRGKQPVRIKEAILFSLTHDLAPDTHLYGESFQMLSQTIGTLAKPVDLAYSERKHYRIPQPEDATALSGMMTLAPAGQNPLLLAFTSSRRFIGRFYVREKSIDVVVDTEGLEIAPGASWELEEFHFATGPSRAEMLSRLATRINQHHKPRSFPAPPTGWCSWYCFGPRVTAQQVLDNLDAIAKNIPGLKYVQIDDGYQPAMGDWLDTGKAFGGDVQGVLKQIRTRGFEPAIWVAPFIAEAESRLFREHPDWFIKGADGKPLPSNQVTFGGWRRGPWYAVDGTHPDARNHLEGLFRTMRRDWGCTYFKLDANFWGAMHGGRFHDPKATRIEAYRRGMEAVLRGAGDSFILGCNHPIWPSFGLIDGSRSSSDIRRDWKIIQRTARENLNRNWQNGRLWWNDPDAIVLAGTLPENEFQFHATAVYASGGMILSGDDLTQIPGDRLAMLKKLLPPGRIAAEFEDESLRVGVIQRPGARMVSVFNWSNEPQSISFKLPAPSRVKDFWSGESLGRHEGSFTVKDLAPHSARLLECTAPKAPFDVAAFDRERVLRAANRYLNEKPITITASTSPRSAGGRHDFFSEGDYWWPDPKNPGGAYIQRDGMTNPDNFTDHRKYMMRLSVQVPALAAAWKITKDARYAKHAAAHLRAWFVAEATRMNPSLLYSQAIHGRFTGRGIGVIDTIHLVEVACAVETLEGSPGLSTAAAAPVKKWFADYLHWMTTHQYGIDERNAKNNHGTCWVMQAAAFARLTGNREVAAFCRDRFKTAIIPDQMGPDGSSPLELKRTKPYGYSLFNLEAMAGICQILSTPNDNLWTFILPDGRGMAKAMAYMAPYIRDKKTWRLKPDVMYHDEWPMRQSSLLFAGVALDNDEYIEVWKKLKPDSEVEEVIRNFFLRQPVLWT